MLFKRAVLAAALSACFFLNLEISQAQIAATLDTETGNNTAACSGLTDPLGNHAYCTGSLIGFSTALGNSMAETSLVDAVAGHVSQLPLIRWLY